MYYIVRVNVEYRSYNKTLEDKHVFIEHVNGKIILQLIKIKHIFLITNIILTIR